MMKSLGRLAARSLAGLVALVVIVGPIIAVARAAGSPFPTDLLDRLGSRRVDDATIVKVLSLAFYACWAWFCAPALRLAWAMSRPIPSGRVLAGGGFADVRHGPRPAEPIGAGPRGLLARLARFAMSGATLASSVTIPLGAVATITSAPAIVAIVGSTMPSGAAGAALRPTVSRSPTTSHQARHRDTPYAVATRYFPAERVDEMRGRIVDLNVGRPLPDGAMYRGGAFPAGFEVVIPATVDAPTTTVETPPPYLEPAVITVELDDNLWELSEDRLVLAGAPHDDAAVAHYLQEVIGGNQDVVEDPDLIFTGEQFVFPAIGTPPPAAPPPPPTEELPRPEPAPSPPPAPVPPTAPPAPILPVESAPQVTPPAAASPTTTTTTTSPAPAPPIDRPPTTTVETSSPSPVGVGEAALLSAGVLALLAARRRHRLRASQPPRPVPEPTPDAVAAERRLRTVDAGERLLRLDVAVRAAAATLVDTDAQVAVVRVGTDGGVELLLTGTATLPPPWQGAGDRWEVPGATTVERLAEAARSVGAPCVALTQLGVDVDGRDVLVDLEALGVLSIAAPKVLADAVVRGIAATLATSIFAEVANLVGVGVDDGVFLGHRLAHTAASVDDAMELAATLVGTTASAKQSTFLLRARHTSGEAWEPAIVLIASCAAAEVTPELVRSAARRRGGLAVVAAGDAPGRAVVDAGRGRTMDAGAGRHRALIPVGLSTREVDELHDVLRQAEEPLVGEPSDAGGDDDDDVAVDRADAPWSLLVRLLGPVEVVDGDGQAANIERSKTLELIVWLTLHRERSTRIGARTALWELDVRDATFANVVSEARRAMARLVEPPAGEEWLGRTLTDVLPLHAGVVTDADLVRRRLHQARLQPPELAIETLRPAVELIRDMPFAGTGYLWPDAEGITSNLVLLATSAAIELAGHHLSMGDVDGVFWATGQGLKVLPGHEELIALRMRAHARAGDLSGVRLEWESYERVLNADPWSDGEPAPKLVLLRRQLLSS